MQEIFEVNANFNKNELFFYNEFLKFFFFIVITVIHLVRIYKKKIIFLLNLLKYFELKSTNSKYNVAHTYLHTLIYTYVCVCIYIFLFFLCIYSFLSSKLSFQ